jgi:hypothetical protein
MKANPIIFTVLGVAFLAKLGSAQATEIVPPPPSLNPTSSAVLAERGEGRLNFRTNLGSFKILDGAGRLEFDFKGTVLVSNLKGGAVQTTGTIRKEWDKDGRQVFTGRGRMTVTGTWRAVQWFGSGLSGFWEGKGIIRIVGEFDRELKTGDYWYEGDKTMLTWPANGIMNVHLPKINYGAPTSVRPRERKKSGG